MIALAVNIPQFADVTSFYRAMGPLGLLRRQIDLNIVSMQSWNWATIKSCDAVFMQRPYTDDHVSIMEIVKDRGVPLWIDYDDLLTAVPTDNPAFYTYMTEKVQKNIIDLVRAADVLTVSTEYLKTALSNLNKNIVVVNNAFDQPDLGRKRPEKMLTRDKAIVWRGSRSHERDVFTYTQSIIQMSRDPKFKDWYWHFIGDTMWFASDNMVHDHTYITKPMELFKYHGHIMDIKPSALMVPLHESHFNLSKSNIAWIEASFAGAVTIAPEWSEWEKPGVLTYESELEFRAHIESVMRGEIDIEAHVKESWDHIQEHYELSKVNKLRADVLGSLLGRSAEEMGWPGYVK